MNWGSAASDLAFDFTGGFGWETDFDLNRDFFVDWICDWGLLGCAGTGDERSWGVGLRLRFAVRNEGRNPKSEHGLEVRDSGTRRRCSSDLGKGVTILFFSGIREGFRERSEFGLGRFGG